MSTPDLATTEGILTYLKTTPFAAEAATQLAGGTGNYTYRVHLQASYAGRNTVVLKHAKPYVKNAQWIPFPIERQVRILLFMVVLIMILNQLLVSEAGSGSLDQDQETPAFRFRRHSAHCASLRRASACHHHG